MITTFTPLASLMGGILIGLGAVILMAFNGRIAGISGIMSGAFWAANSDRLWRIVFMAGAVAAPLIATAGGAEFDFAAPTDGVLLALGGVIVGLGVSIGGGCTSGHGVCGLARLSPRSLAATVTFMATALATVTLIRHGLGG